MEKEHAFLGVDEYSATLGADSRLSVSCVTFGCESKNFNDSAVVDRLSGMPLQAKSADLRSLQLMGSTGLVPRPQPPTARFGLANPKAEGQSTAIMARCKGSQ